MFFVIFLYIRYNLFRSFFNEVYKPSHFFFFLDIVDNRVDNNGTNINGSIFTFIFIYGVKIEENIKFEVNTTVLKLLLSIIMLNYNNI